MPFPKHLTSLVFVDPTVDDYCHLVRGVISSAEVVVLNPEQDGIAQISAALSDRQHIQSLHIVSHGEPGCLRIGSTRLNLDTLNAYAHQVRQWSNALTAQAEVLLYGCNLATGQAGAAFVQQLKKLLNVNIAASTGLTGNAALGGSWELAYKTGAIASRLAFQQWTIDTYSSVLASAFPNVLYGVVNNELRVLNLSNATSTPVGTLLFNSFAIARDATTGRVFYLENTINGRVAAFDPATGNNTLLPNRTGINVQFLKLAQSVTDLIYGLDSSTATIYTIDPTTNPATGGRATALGIITGGNPPFSAGSGDIAFDPEDPTRLFVTVTSPAFYRLYSVNINTLQATFIGDTGLIGDVGSGALAFGQDGQLYTTSTVNGVPNLYRLDRSSGTATLIGTTGVEFNDFGTLPIRTQTVDLSINKTDGLASSPPGSQITYTVTVSSPAGGVDLQGITVTDDISPILTGVTWTAVITGGVGSFPTPADQSGTGNAITSNVNLNAGATATYTITGTISPSATPGSTLINTATATVPNGINDPNTVNNTVSDTTTIAIASANVPPAAVSTASQVQLGATVPVSGLAATDPDSAIASFTILTLPPATQGTLFLGDPVSGGTPIGAGQVLTPTQITQVFFQTSSGFTGSSFTYTATDALGAVDPTPATVTLSSTPVGGVPSSPDPTANDAIATLAPGNTVNVPGLSADDPGSPIISYTITSLPPAGQGTLFLGNPASGGVPITVGQVLTPDDIAQIFFQASSTFTGSSFTYTASNLTGTSDATPATVNLSLFSEDNCGPGVRRRGNGGNNTLRGTDDEDQLFGLGGNDRLLGLPCNDLLDGGRGNDFLRGDSGNDTLRGRQNRDQLLGGTGTDLLSGGLGFDRLDGGRGDDRLQGGRGRDTLNGGGGNDVLDGGADADAMTGNSNNDILRGRQNNDRVFGGGGVDYLNGGFGNDVLDGGKGSDNIQGGRGRDRLTGRGGSDFLSGGRGNDAIRGGSNSDYLVGRQNNDTIAGGGGVDLLLGGLGADRFTGGKGNDTIFAGRGKDRAEGGDGNDFLNGGLSDDLLRGGFGSDRLEGRQNNDILNGGGGNDQVAGNAGRDILRGRGSNDTLNGGFGRDILVGGFGADILSGGAGGDRFIYRSLRHRGDRITDFSAADDVINLRTILNASIYTRSQKFAAYVRLIQVGSNTAVRVDTNGGSSSGPFQTLLVLENTTADTLTASNFIV